MRVDFLQTWWPLLVPLLAYAGVTLGVLALVLYGAVAKLNNPQDEAQATVFAGVSAWLPDRVVGLLVEGACQAFAFLCQFLHRLRLLPRYEGTGSGTPVIVLPGYTENAGTMWWLCRRLARDGFNVYGLDFPSTFMRIDRNVEYLHARIQEIRAKHGGEPVAVVAHSMGGVVTRALALEHTDHGVGTLVAFASPFRGANIARLGTLFRFGRSVVDMRPGSPFMHRYHHDRPVPMPTLSIVALQESIVTPEWSVVAAGVETCVLPRAWGHGAPLYLAQPFLLARDWLLTHGVRRDPDAATSR